MAVTIKDVAKETNLAISTISKYMNGGTVREENKKAIDEAVKKMGYQPNKAARGLRTSSSYMIGLILDGLENQHFSLIASSITEILKQQGYTVIVCCHRNDGDKAKKAVEFLIERQVDGIIETAINSDIDYLKSARTYNIPVVAIDRPENVPCDVVASNSAEGSYQAVEHLIIQGHRKIAVITGTNKANAGLKAAEERLRGYKRVLEDYSIVLREEYIQNGSFDLASGYRCMEELWCLEDRPTALFITNYNMTLGAIAAVHNLKVKIPDDLSVVAFDDLEFSTLCRPELSAVGQPVEEIARTSVELLLRRIKGDYESFPEFRRLATKLHIRDSVKKINKS